MNLKSKQRSGRGIVEGEGEGVVEGGHWRLDVDREAECEASGGMFRFLAIRG